MANNNHLARLKKGVNAWNAWRERNPEVSPNLSKANLSGADLIEADLSSANLSGAKLRRAKLFGADLRRANLSGAHLRDADLGETILWEADLSYADLNGASLPKADLNRAELKEADLSGAKLLQADLFSANLNKANLKGAILRRAHLSNADFSEADLREAQLYQVNVRGANFNRADLRGADLQAATVLDTNFSGADLTGCRIYGISAWNLKLEGTKQQNLVITREDEPEITVDDIEVAQFIYLLLHNEKIRNVVDTIGRKGVLLLGRFTKGRIGILERLREKLRSLGFVPMVFNFDKPETKNFTETVRLLANLSYFVIVDITNPRSTPLELQATVPDYMIPFAPILQEGEEAFSMFVDLLKYDWVLKPVNVYSSVDRLIEGLEDKIVRPAEAKFDELLTRRTEKLRFQKM
jgi:uncharacterized protein YjbI with pentapeptide repeats